MDARLRLRDRRWRRAGNGVPGQHRVPANRRAERLIPRRRSVLDPTTRAVTLDPDQTVLQDEELADVTTSPGPATPVRPTQRRGRASMPQATRLRCRRGLTARPSAPTRSRQSTTAASGTRPQSDTPPAARRRKHPGPQAAPPTRGAACCVCPSSSFSQLPIGLRRGHNIAGSGGPPRVAAVNSRVRRRSRGSSPDWQPPS